MEVHRNMTEQGRTSINTFARVRDETCNIFVYKTNHCGSHIGSKGCKGKGIS